MLGVCVAGGGGGGVVKVRGGRGQACTVFMSVRLSVRNVLVSVRGYLISSAY